MRHGSLVPLVHTHDRSMHVNNLQYKAYFVQQNRQMSLTTETGSDIILALSRLPNEFPNRRHDRNTG